jgi:hypothetical protein
MKVTLTPQESEDLFYTALCNGLGYIESGYDLELTFEEKDYDEACKKLTSPCYEDVFMQMLRDGKSLTLVDVGCEGEYTRSITMKDVHERVQDTDIRHLMDAINENDDAVTADVILQQVFFQETIFG